MKTLLKKLFTLGEILSGFAFVLLALGGLFATFIFNALLGVAGFFILLDGLEHIDDPLIVTPPSEDNKKDE